MEQIPHCDNCRHYTDELTESGDFTGYGQCSVYKYEVLATDWCGSWSEKENKHD